MMYFTMWRIAFLACCSCLTTVFSVQAPPPPRITNFLSHDLVKPDEVKFHSKYDAVKHTGFRLPCEASGSNLQWRWQHNGSYIVPGAKYKLGDDGSLTGNFLEANQSGNYQCFVKDTVTSKETFSRKLKVSVTYIEDFTFKTSRTVIIQLGQSFSYSCPPHGPNYGASYHWLSRNGTAFKRDAHRAITPDGQLFIMYVTQRDINEITSLKGIACTIIGANQFYFAGSLMLEKRTAGDPGTLNSPSWGVTPNRVETAIEGRDKALYCLAVGRPAPKITWKKNGQRIIQGQNSFEIPDTHHGRLLNIVNARKDLHQDKYTCEAENSVNTGNPLVYEISLNVEVPPRWIGDTPPPAKKAIDQRGNGTLVCNVVADPLPSYKWYKDGSRIFGSNNTITVVKNTLELRNVSFAEDGVYQCVAENRLGMIVSSTWVQVLGVPSPPTNLELSGTCQNRTTTLSWVAGVSNGASFVHFLVEQESNFDPNIFSVIYNVTTPNAASVTLNLTGWANLRFRVRAVSNYGLSSPSLPTRAGLCITSSGAPDKSPNGLRGIPKMGEELFIIWTPMPKIDWNAPGLHYVLQYRRVEGEPHNNYSWYEQRIGDPVVSTYMIPDPGYYKLWEFRIRAGNDEGPGPFSTIKKSFSGQDAPKGKPENVVVFNITTDSVKISWQLVIASQNGSVDGYRIYYWSENRSTNGKRRGRAIPSYAAVLNITGGQTQRTTAYGLSHSTNYILAIKAFNSGGEGPSSEEVSFSTIEAGSPSTGHHSTGHHSTASPYTDVPSTTNNVSARLKGCNVFISGVLILVLALSNIP